MRIDELTGIKSITNQNRISERGDIVDLMKSQGFEHIGDGYSGGDVFAHPKLNYVVKLFSPHDRGYLTFLRMYGNSKSPFTPRFIGKPTKLKLTSVDNNQHFDYPVYFIRMERLEPITANEWVDEENKGLDWMERYWQGMFRIENIPDEYKEWYLEHKNFCDFMKNLYSKKRPKSVHPDIHPGNFMKRGNIWVVIDPFQGR